MKSISKILVTIAVLLSFTNIHAQIQNSVTENVKVYGSCGMCKSKIEKAGFLKNVSKVTWNEDSQIASLEYDAKKTNQDEILKRIALVGYDSDKFLAPDKTYSKLDKCCQYDRPKKEIVKTETPKIEISGLKTIENQGLEQLQSIFENYFAVKDGLVQTDAKTASQKATALLSAINTVKMETLKTNEHMVWMKVLKDLTNDSKSIVETQDIEKQRNVFNSLSKSVYELINYFCWFRNFY